MSTTSAFLGEMLQGTTIEFNGKDNSEEKSLTEKAPKKISLIFMCIPTSPGRSRVIWSFPRNFFTVFFKIIPQWVTHMTNSLVLDSDMLLLHLLVSPDPTTWSQGCVSLIFAVEHQRIICSKSHAVLLKSGCFILAFCTPKSRKKMAQFLLKWYVFSDCMTC